ncbi:hypothetical protein [Thiosocius teredinicola]|uniref:hypothetical protein n=1 Tax=Thiosocius teredinicola TaxID=1973002 RepID=UPI000990C3C7
MNVCTRAAAILTCSMMLLGGCATHKADAPPSQTAGPQPLDRESLVLLVNDKTAECRKEKDQSLCTNYFSDDGRFVRLMHEDGAKREGVWFVDDSDRLCILWSGRIKPLCFLLYEQADGSYTMIKKGKHISTLLDSVDGNPKGL